MAEQIIDIRERIENMRIKFENDHKNSIYDEFDNEKKEINNSQSEIIDHQKKEIKASENNNLPKSNTLSKSNTEFPSVQLSVKNPISSKILVFLMVLQVFSNIGIFMLLLDVLE